MNTRRIDPHKEVEKIYTQIMYENSREYKEKELVRKIKLLLQDNLPEKIFDINRPVIFEYINIDVTIERGKHYRFAIKGLNINVYLDTQENKILICISRKATHLKHEIIHTKTSFDVLSKFLEYIDDEHHVRNKTVNDILDYLLQ